MVELFDIVIVKRVAALRTEFRRILRVFRFPAALVAAIKGRAFGLFRSALRAELSFVDCAARAGPAAFVRRLFRAAFGTEVSGNDCAAGAFP